MKHYAAVFDSGLGGLAVLKAMKAAYPRQNFVFLADNRQLPLGDKPVSRIQEISLAGARLLASWQGGCSALVIACGTSSAHAAPLIQGALPLPVIEIIAPTVAHMAAAVTPKSVGVLATSATIASGRYKEEILRLLPHCHVMEKAAPALVPLIEGGGGIALERQIAEELSAFPEDTEAFLLGCTHYSLIKEQVQKLRPHAFIADAPPAVIQKFAPLASEGTGEDVFLCTLRDASWEERSARLMGRPLHWQEIPGH